MAADTFITPNVVPDITSSSSTALVPIGTLVNGTFGSEYMYIIAQSAIAQYDCVAILNSSSAATSVCASPMTTTFGALSPRVGFAQTALAAGAYGWVAIKGSNLRVNVLISCQPAVGLYTTSTPGSLDDAIVSAGYVAGCVAISSAASASAVQCIVSNANIEVSGF